MARGAQQRFIEKVPIPDVDKQVVLLTAPQLEQARTIYAFANPGRQVGCCGSWPASTCSPSCSCGAAPTWCSPSASR